MNILFTSKEDKLHPIKLIQYLSIKSFAKYNPSSSIYLISDGTIPSDWMLLFNRLDNFHLVPSDPVSAGLYVDLGYICKKSCDQLFNNDSNYALENRNVDYCYSEGIDYTLVFFKDSQARSDYNQGKKLDYKIVNRTLFSPFDNTRKDNNDLFFHNKEKEIFYCFNTYLSSNYNDYLTYLDIEYILTVDTTFTKLVREFITDIKDYDFNF